MADNYEGLGGESRAGPVDRSAWRARSESTPAPEDASKTNISTPHALELYLSRGGPHLGQISYLLLRQTLAMNDPSNKRKALGEVRQHTLHEARSY